MYPSITLFAIAEKKKSEALKEIMRWEDLFNRSKKQAETKQIVLDKMTARNREGEYEIPGKPQTPRKSK